MSETETPDRHFYDRISKFYDHLTNSNEHVAREKGQSALALQPGESVLEVGFGPGRALVYFAHQVGPTGRVLGLDVSEGMREVAQQRLADAHALSRAELKVGDGRELPFDDNSVDAVFMSFTLELFELDDIPKVLAESRRVLRDHGRIGIVSMDDQPGAGALQNIYKWLHRHFPHAIDCQPIHAAQYLDEAGFNITHREEMEIWSLPVAILVGRK